MSEDLRTKKQEVLRALENREFIPYFQPQYNYLQRTVSGAEVLARWKKSDGSIAAPVEFIPILEEDNSIIELDYQIMEATCAQYREWLNEGKKLPPVSINLSRRTSLDEKLVERTKETLEKYSLSPSMFHLELTESAYIENYDVMFSRVQELKKSGFVLEMDDFGSGYSSLGFLRDAPMNILKMDMSFLRMDKNRGKGGSIISAIVRLAGDLGMGIIAEGVETLEQAEFLKSVGCFFMQGYYFSRPMEAKEFAKELESRDVYVAPEDSFHEVNKALDFLDDTTQSALLFNSFVGGAAILEYFNKDCYIVRANDRFFDELGVERDYPGILNTGLLNYFENNSRLALVDMLEKAIETESESAGQVLLGNEEAGNCIWLQIRARCLAKKSDDTYVFYVVINNISEQKRLAAKNVEISHELSSVINNIPGGFARFTFAGDSVNCEFMSEGFVRLTRRSRSELEKGFAESITRFVHPDDAEMVKRTFQSMKSDLRGRRLVYRLVASDGNFIWVGSQNSIVQSGDGYSMFSYCWDETDRMNLKDKLQFQNSELQNVKESLEGGTALYEMLSDGQINLLEISAEAAAISGRTPEEYKQEFEQDSLFCTFPADKKRIEEAVRAAENNPSDFDLIYRVVAKDGKIIWVRFKATVSKEANDRKLLFAVFTNLSATREMYQSIINDADTAIVVTDLKTHEILYANEKAADFGGMTPESTIGCTCYECLHKCSSITTNCQSELPPEGLIFDEVRDGRVMRVRRKRIDWGGIEAGICYITDRTDTVFRDNAIVDKATLSGTIKKISDAYQEPEDMLPIGNKKWKNVISMVLERKSRYENLLTDEKMRIRIQFLCVYVVLGIVSLGMTLMNHVTGWESLGKMTLVFGLLNILNVGLCLISEKTERLTQILYAIEMVALFTGFAIVGEPEGFSILWSVLLPTLGLFLYRARFGSILSIIQWLILVALFWTKAGNSLLQYEYTATFLARYPILYMALFCLGSLFELVRSTTQRELNEVRGEFEYLYNHDALTGLYNRYGFNATIENITDYSTGKNMAFAILDLDNFKSVNDTYGHMQGDKVLKDTGKLLMDVVGEKGVVCRWGGEEFSILFFDAEEASELCNTILESCRVREFEFDGKTVHVTISIGLVKFEGFSLGGTSEVITKADENLYASKTNGKDRLTETTIKL